MPRLTIECPQSVLVALKEDVRSFKRELSLAAAMKFYELGRLSSGRAAQLAGVSRVEFLDRMAEFGVSALAGSGEELEEDVRNA